MDESKELNRELFGDVTEYKNIITNLLESLKLVTPETFYDMASSSSKGLSTLVVMDIINTILDSFDIVSDNLYSNNLVVHEFPIFIEIKNMVECLLLEPIYESDDYLNMAIRLTSDFLTLMEVKLLLFDGYFNEVEAPDHIRDEYDKELDNYLERFNECRDEFIEMGE